MEIEFIEATLEPKCLTELIYRLCNFTRGIPEKTAECALVKKYQVKIFIAHKNVAAVN